MKKFALRVVVYAVAIIAIELLFGSLHGIPFWKAAMLGGLLGSVVIAVTLIDELR